MSQLNVLSTENINIYKKFKLDNGNLYIDNEKNRYRNIWCW